MQVSLKYGKGHLDFEVPDKNVLGYVNAKHVEGAPDVDAEIRRALQHTIGTSTLDSMAKPGMKVAMVVDDNTRETPSPVMVNPILDILNSKGIPDEDITIIIGHGDHRKITDSELVDLLGKEIIERINIEPHNSKADDLVYVGTTKTYNNDVYINKTFANANLKILTGDVTIHYYAGFGGGRKSILPAVSGAETINRNHGMCIHPKAKTMNLDGNPVHIDMVEAARLAGPNFIINIVQNDKKEIVKAYAGDLVDAWMEGVKLLSSFTKVSVDRYADIVIVSSGGYPKDINLYQAYKALDNAMNIVRHGGVVIWLAECSDGIGHVKFEEWMKKYQTLEEMEESLSKKFVMGGHKAMYLLRALNKADIVLVSNLDPKEVKNTYRLEPAKTVDDALDYAFSKVGNDAKIWIMPKGGIVWPEVKRS